MGGILTALASRPVRQMNSAGESAGVHRGIPFLSNFWTFLFLGQYCSGSSKAGEEVLWGRMRTGREIISQTRVKWHGL